MSKATEALNRLPIQRRESRLAKLPFVGLGVAAGALAAFFLDPDRGRSRRALTRDQLAGAVRRAGRRAGRAVRWSRGPVVGLASEVITSPGRVETPIDDATLAHKVETELFRDRSVPKGQINVNAENGTVILRGIVESRDQIEKLLAATASVTGVHVARSLLRTRDEPTETPLERPGKSPLPVPSATGTGR